MQQLPNNCRIGKISVFPNNWDDKTLDKTVINSIWYVKYRFYDDNIKKSKQVVIKGMNEYKTQKEKQDAVRSIIEMETEDLKNGLNKFTGKFHIEQTVDISPKTPLISALEFAFEKLELVETTKIDIKSCIKYFSESATQLKLNALPLDQVSKKHIRLILDNISNLNVSIQKRDKKSGEMIAYTRKKIWNASQYNHYRSFLGMLFKELEEFDAISHNPATALSKKTSMQKLKEVLTNDERRSIVEYLKEKNFRLYLFVNIFFHSGARLTEFGRLKIKDIDLQNLSVKFLVKKGKAYKETLRPIKKIALTFWQQYLQECNDKEFYFLGQDLCPSNICIKKNQLTRRWKRWVKDHLGIDKDLYSLKHLNLEETAAALSIQDAAAMAGHTTPVITMKHYVHGEKERQNEKLRKMTNQL